METEIVDRSTQTTLEHVNDSYLASSVGVQDEDLAASREPRLIAIVRLLWPKRPGLAKAALAGLLIGSIVALLIPNSYQATVRLMPPDSSSISGGGTSSALLGLVLGTGPSGASGGGGSS